MTEPITGQFKRFCRGWTPSRRGSLCRTWQGHLCRMGYTPGGYWASIDGRLLSDTFSDGNVTLAAFFAECEVTTPGLVGAE